MPEGEAYSAYSAGYSSFGISHDGENIVYSANDQLWVRHLGSLEARPVPGAEEEPINPQFSPDNQWIVYWASAAGQLKKVPIGGGTPISLCAATSAYGIAWYNDTIYFGQGSSTMSVSENGGSPNLVDHVQLGVSEEGCECSHPGRKAAQSRSDGCAVKSNAAGVRVVLKAAAGVERRSSDRSGQQSGY